jgi:2-oxoglutarate dehydrogenase E2 component (dihydrolipoamide succinyltransferase)
LPTSLWELFIFAHEKKDIMAQIEIRLPKMGESVTEAVITNWLKEVGDTVEMDEPLVEVATDKVDNELPSEAAGVLVQKLFEKDQTVQVGEVIAIISTDGSVGEDKDVPVAEPAVAAAVVEEQVAQTVESVADVSRIDTSSSSRFYSPLVKSIASRENISVAELESIQGTGAGGRVTKKDILAYLENRGSIIVSAQQASTAGVVTSTSNGVNAQADKPKAKSSIVINAQDEIIEMDRMRRIIAENMVASKHTSPHVTSYVEADVTNIVNWRNRVKDAFEKREGEKITFTPIFIEAIVKAIKDFPMINISVDGTNIIKRGNINIGMAAALPSGNLIVPVIHNADRMNLLGITKAVNDLAKRARQNKLKSDEISGGTYTITNVGSFGNVMGTPIIPQPQVAIMAVGAIRKMPAVIETPEGDMIAIRHKMFLSHAYDHRVVDGALGGQFVRRVADYLESFDTKTEI